MTTGGRHAAPWLNFDPTNTSDTTDQSANQWLVVDGSFDSPYADFIAPLVSGRAKAHADSGGHGAHHATDLQVC